MLLLVLAAAVFSPSTECCWQPVTDGAKTILSNLCGHFLQISHKRISGPEFIPFSPRLLIPHWKTNKGFLTSASRTILGAQNKKNKLGKQCSHYRVAAVGLG